MSGVVEGDMSCGEERDRSVPQKAERVSLKPSRSGREPRSVGHFLPVVKIGTVWGGRGGLWGPGDSVGGGTFSTHFPTWSLSFVLPLLLIVLQGGVSSHAHSLRNFLLSYRYVLISYFVNLSAEFCKFSDNNSFYLLWIKIVPQQTTINL